LNDGSGNFTDSGQILGSNKSIGIALGDLEGDGDLDAFVANYSQGNRVWLNVGSGNFLDSGLSLGSNKSRSVALGDLDEDGDLDAFVANADRNRIWLNSEYIVYIDLTGNGTITGTGINCPGDCTESFDYGTTVGLVAAPESGYIVAEWTGCDTVDGNNCTVLVDDYFNPVSVRFAKSYKVTVSVQPDAGGVIQSNGIDCPTDCDELYPEGADITLTATPSPGYVFEGWHIGNCIGTSPCVVSVNSDLDVVARFFSSPNVQTGTALPDLNSSLVEGSVNPGGLQTNVWFEWGTTQSYGNQTLAQSIGSGFADVAVSEVIPGLAHNTTYHYRIVAQNTMGITYGEDRTFMTLVPITLSVSVSGNGTVTSTPAGINCPGSECVNQFKMGSDVTLHIQPDLNYHVKEVVIDGISQGAISSYTFTNLTGAHNVIVVFEIDTHMLTVDKTGTGGGTVTSGPGAINCGSVCYDTFAHGTTVTLTPQPDNASDFKGWSGDGDCLDGVVTVNSDTSCTALFDLKNYIIHASSGSGGSISPSGEVVVTHGNNQSFTITPDVNYHVEDVLIDGVSHGQITSYTFEGVNSDHTISVSFVLNQYTLMVNKTGTGQGNVTSDQGTIDCGDTCSDTFDYGSTLTLTATPDTGYVFAGWGSDCISCGIAEICDLNIDGDKICTSFFLKTSAECTFIISTTEELQAALNTAKSNGQDDTICVNGGKYNLISPLVYDNSDGIAPENYALTIRGDNTAQEVVLDGEESSLIMNIDVCEWNGTDSCNLNLPNADITIENITFQNGFNLGGDGGGLYVRTGSSGITLVNNVFAGNSTNSLGGGFYAETVSGSVTVTNNTLTGNTSAYGGGGFIWLNDNSASANIFNNIIWSNTSSAGGGDGDDIYVEPDGDLDITGAVVNVFNNDFSCLLNPAVGLPASGSCLWVARIDNYSFSDNVSYDPLFVDSSSDNYHLGVGSPCIDTGINSAPSLPATDKDGNNRMYPVTGGTVDMGAYEAVYYSLDITTNGNGNGTVTKSPDVTKYVSGTQVTLTASAGSDSDFTTWGGDCSACGTNTTCDIEMDADKTCTATFIFKTYRVTPSVGGGQGTISPDTPQTVSHGSTMSFTLSPASCYHTESITGTCGGTLSGDTFATNQISGDCTVVANFAINTYQINVSAGSGGSISPSGTQTVNCGADQTFIITPDAGYHIMDVVIDDVSQGAITSYTFSNVTGDHTISATFEIDIHNITVKQSGTGTGTVTSSPSGIDCGTTCSAQFDSGTDVT